MEHIRHFAKSFPIPSIVKINYINHQTFSLYFNQKEQTSQKQQNYLKDFQTLPQQRLRESSIHMESLSSRNFALYILANWKKTEPAAIFSYQSKICYSPLKTTPQLSEQRLTCYLSLTKIFPVSNRIYGRHLIFGKRVRISFRLTYVSNFYTRHMEVYVQYSESKASKGGSLQ